MVPSINAKEITNYLRHSPIQFDIDPIKQWDWKKGRPANHRADDVTRSRDGKISE